MAIGTIRRVWRIWGHSQPSATNLPQVETSQKTTIPRERSDNLNSFSNSNITTLLSNAKNGSLKHKDKSVNLSLKSTTSNRKSKICSHNSTSKEPNSIKRSNPWENSVMTCSKSSKKRKKSSFWLKTSSRICKMATLLGSMNSRPTSKS